MKGSSVCVFSVEQYPAACGIPEERALAFLVEFEQRVVVVRKLRTYCAATPFGLSLSRGPSLAAPEARAA
jgi:hypothetical protein